MRLAIQNGHSLSGLGSSGGKEMERMCEEKHGTRVRARRFHGTFWTPLASTAGFSNMRWWNMVEPWTYGPFCATAATAATVLAGA